MRVRLGLVFVCSVSVFLGTVWPVRAASLASLTWLAARRGGNTGKSGHKIMGHGRTSQAIEDGWDVSGLTYHE